MDKKQKQMIGIGATVVVVIILILAFSGGDSSVSSSNKVVPATLNEKQKYAMFSAEVACELVKVMDGMDENNMEGFIQQTITITEEAADKYSYTLSEIESKRIEYLNDAEFQRLAQDYVFDICPEIATQTQLQQ